jgi:hypothetical protein
MALRTPGAPVASHPRPGDQVNHRVRHGRSPPRSSHHAPPRGPDGRRPRCARAAAAHLRIAEPRGSPRDGSGGRLPKDRDGDGLCAGHQERYSPPGSPPGGRDGPGHRGRPNGPILSVQTAPRPARKVSLFVTGRRLDRPCGAPPQPIGVGASGPWPARQGSPKLVTKIRRNGPLPGGRGIVRSIWRRSDGRVR